MELSAGIVPNRKGDPNPNMKKEMKMMDQAREVVQEQNLADLKLEPAGRPDKTETMEQPKERRFRLSPLEQRENMLKRLADEVINLLAEREISAGVSLEVLDVAKSRLPYRCHFLSFSVSKK